MTEPSLEQHRILVVDDEEYLTDLLSTSLRFQGFEVAIAGNGFDALSTAGSFAAGASLVRVRHKIEAAESARSDVQRGWFTNIDGVSS